MKNNDFIGFIKSVVNDKKLNQDKSTFNNSVWCFRYSEILNRMTVLVLDKNLQMIYSATTSYEGHIKDITYRYYNEDKIELEEEYEE